MVARQQRRDESAAAVALTASNALARQVAKVARLEEEKASVPRLLALFRDPVHAYSLAKVSPSDKTVAACTAVLKHHFQVTEAALKGKKHPALKELLSAKLEAEKVALPPAV